MGSVIVHWEGTCHDRERQMRLAEQVEPLARLSHSFFPEPPNIIRHDRPLEGRVLVSQRALSGPPTTLKALWDTPDELPGGYDLRVVGSGKAPKLRLGQTAEASEVAVSGIAFRLYDGRNIYPGEDEVSLVFASSSTHPELDGRLVTVHGPAECAESDHPALRSADWYLTDGSIHLRHYCEQWMDLFLGTIKYFYVPDLAFWRYEVNPQYKDLVKVLQSQDSPDLVDRAFAVLAENFRAHVENWRETAASVDKFWRRARSSQNKRTG